MERLREAGARRSSAAKFKFKWASILTEMFKWLDLHARQGGVWWDVGTAATTKIVSDL